MAIFVKFSKYYNFLLPFLDHSIVANLGVAVLSNLMPKMYPILERFPNIAMNYYKSLNCFVELLVCNNEVRTFSISQHANDTNFIFWLIQSKLD